MLGTCLIQLESRYILHSLKDNYKQRLVSFLGIIDVRLQKLD